MVQVIKTVTRDRSEAVAEFAFAYAAAHGRHRVTALHKSNVMRLSDGAFLRACRRVSSRYPAVAYAEEKLDTFCLRVTDDPGRYDVLLTPSLYGAIASAVCGTLSGGVLAVPCVAYGPRAAVFGTMDVDGTACEHRRFGGGSAGGSAGGFAGDSACELVSGRHLVANPTGLIRAAARMLDHVGMADDARRVRRALRRTVRLGVRTRDMGGVASCVQFTDAVVRDLIDPEDGTRSPHDPEDVDV